MPGQRLGEWLDALTRQGCDPKRSGKQYKSKCPSHDDRHESLSVTENADGKVLVKCHAGCAYADIRGALTISRSLVGAATAKPKPEEPMQPRKRLPGGRDVTHFRYVTAAGDTHGVVLRRDDPKRGKPVYSQWRPVEGGWLPFGPEKPHPLYLLPDLDQPGTVVVVEGEKCAEAVRRYWPERAVTAWMGGATARGKSGKLNAKGQKWHYTDWEPLRGREVSLLADADQAGHDAMTTLAEHLDGLGCRVKIMLPAFDDDQNDIADWLATDLATATEKVRVGLKPWRVTNAEPDPVPSSEETIREVGARVFEEMAETGAAELSANRYYRLLGVGDTDGHVHVQYVRSGVFDSFRRSSLCEKKSLIGLAPEMFWLRQTEGAFGPQQAVQLGDSLIRAAETLGPFDASALLGRGAAMMEDGVVLWHLGDRLLRPDGTTTETLEYGGQLFIAQPPIVLVDSASDAVMREFAEAVMCYRWRSADDGRRFLGWLAAALAAGGLEHRPHIALIAAASTGKTWLLEKVAHRVIGPVGFFVADVSAAGLARMTGTSSMPVVADEAEPTALDAILPTLRSASGGVGMRVRASMSGAGIDVQRSRFACMIVATALPRLGSADTTRISAVNLGPPIDDWPSVESRIMDAVSGHGPSIRSRFIRHSALMIAHADRVARELRATGADSRDAAASAALTAGWAEWGAADALVPAEVAAGAARSDAAVALQTILELTTNVPGVGERTLWRLLTGSNDSASLAADTFGVKRYETSDGLVLAFGHSQLIRRLRGTRWQHHDLKRLLLQMPEIPSERYQARIGGKRVDCVWIPPVALAAIGYSFAELARDSEAF